MNKIINLSEEEINKFIKYKKIFEENLRYLEHKLISQNSCNTSSEWHLYKNALHNINIICDKL